MKYCVVRFLLGLVLISQPQVEYLRRIVLTAMLETRRDKTELLMSSVSAVGEMKNANISNSIYFQFLANQEKKILNLFNKQ